MAWLDDLITAAVGSLVAGAAEVAKAKGPLTDAPGVPGFSVYGGYLSTGEKSGDLAGSARWTLDASTKRNVAIVGAGLRRSIELIGAPAWHVPPFDPDDPDDVLMATFAESQLANLATPWRTVVQTGGMARFDGVAIQVWAARKLPPDHRDHPGWIGLADVVSRPIHTIERWDIDEGGAVLGVWQRDPTTGAEHYLERGRMIYTRDLPINDSPAGTGLMRHVAEPVRELLELRKIHNQGIETDLAGIPVMYAPIEAQRALIGKTVGGKTYTAADFTRDISGTTDLASNPIRTKKSALVLDSGSHKAIDGSPTGPPLYKVELLQTGGRSHEVVAARIAAVTWEIAIVLGVEFLLLGADGSGSLAMAQVKARDFYRLIVGFLNGYAETIQRDLLRPLWALNGRDPERAPRPSYDKLEFEDVVGVVTGLLPAIAQAGIPLDRRDLDLVNLVLSRVGLPPLEAHEEDLTIRGPLAQAHGLDKPGKGADAADLPDGVEVDGEDGSAMGGATDSASEEPS